MKNIIIAMTLCLTACSTAGPHSKTWDANNDSLILEAEHRAIINVTQDDIRKICAEPSPDALSTIASKLNTKLGGAKGPVTGSLAGDRELTESVTMLTKRTQAIQFLRDGLYRACEANINGLIGPEEYRSILVSYDEILIALTAIEQLGEQEDTAEDIKEVVRDYYCLQLTYKSHDDVQEVKDRMCKNNK